MTWLSPMYYSLDLDPQDGDWSGSFYVTLTEKVLGLSLSVRCCK